MPNTSLPPLNRVLALLVRHGHTALNAKKKLRAWEDVPLDKDGEADAYLAANKIKIYKPKIVYSSDLIRDFQTGQIIAEVCGNIPYETDFALRTADMGVLSGMGEEETAERVRDWYENTWVPAPSGESYDNFEKRFWKFYETKLELAREVAAFRPSIFVTHGRPIAAAHAYYTGVHPVQSRMPMPGGIAVVRDVPDGHDSFEFITDWEPVLTDA